MTERGAGPLRPSEWRFVERHRVARFATVDAQNQPHVVPVCFAVLDGAIYLPLDEKPKRVAPTALRRVQNLQANPRVALLVDDYVENWEELAYVQVRGVAHLVEPGEAIHGTVVVALRQKYPQYQSMKLEAQPLIRITPTAARSWSGSGRAFP